MEKTYDIFAIRRIFLLRNADMAVLAATDADKRYFSAKAAAALAAARYGSEDEVVRLRSAVLAAGFSHQLVSKSALIARGWSPAKIEELLGSELVVPEYGKASALYPAIVALEFESKGLGLRGKAKKADPAERLAGLGAARLDFEKQLAEASSKLLSYDPKLSGESLVKAWRTTYRGWNHFELTEFLGEERYAGRETAKFLDSYRPLFRGQRLAPITEKLLAAEGPLPRPARHAIINQCIWKTPWPDKCCLNPAHADTIAVSMKRDVARWVATQRPDAEFDAGRMLRDHPLWQLFNLVKEKVNAVIATAEKITREPLTSRETAVINGMLPGLAAGLKGFKTARGAKVALGEARLKEKVEPALRTLRDARLAAIFSEASAFIDSQAGTLPEQWLKKRLANIKDRLRWMTRHPSESGLFARQLRAIAMPVVAAELGVAVEELLLAAERRSLEHSQQDPRTET